VVDAVKDNFSEPFVIDPDLIRGGIGVKIMHREATAPQDLSAEKEMTPKVRINLWVREKIEERGQEQKPKNKLANIYPFLHWLLYYID